MPEHLKLWLGGDWKKQNIPNRQQQTGSLKHDCACLFVASEHEYQGMQVQNSTRLEVSLMQLNS